MSADSRERWLIRTLFVLPLLSACIAYLWMIRMYGQVNLWSVLVHESGKYTLAQTIFFTSHFCREWPVKLVYLLIGWTLFRAYNPPAALAPGQASRARTLGFVSLAATVLLLVTTFVSGVSKTGLHDALFDLTQFHSNDTAPALWGSHWRFHFLSGIAFCGGAGFLSLISASAPFDPSLPTGGRAVPILAGLLAGARRRGVLWPALALFLGATIFFLPGLDSFRDGRYLGHQFREATGADLPIALPLMIGTFLFWRRRFRPPTSPTPVGDETPSWRPLAGWLLLAGVPVVLNALLLLTVDIGSQVERLPGAKQWSLPDLYAAHVFEHSLDYLFYVVAGSALILLSSARASTRRQA